MKKSILFVLFSIFCVVVSAQQESVPFKMSAKPTITIHSNFKTDIAQPNNYTGFNLERAYLGTTFVLSENLSGRVRFDIGNPNVADSDLEMVAYVKNAEIKWQQGDFTLNAGMISTIQFAVQEKFWGYRYLLKSFQDEYKFGSSADLGIAASYKISDLITIDAIAINGEGYKKVNKDDALRYGGGVLISPSEWILLRAYYDRNDVATGAIGATQENVGLFAGISLQNITLGAEYNTLYNVDRTRGNHQYGYSVYSTVVLPKQFQLYGRWDYLFSSNEYNLAKDGQLGVLGVQYSINKYVQLSPNLRIWQSAEGGAAKLCGLVNLQVNF